VSAAATIMSIGAMHCGTAQAQTYVLTDLGTLGGSTSSAFGLNRLGSVAGSSASSQNHVEGFLFEGGFTAISPLVGDHECQAFGVNETGDVVATSYDLGETELHGLLLKSGTPIWLGNMAARGLNDAGIAVGHVTLSDPDFVQVQHAARWQNQAITDLGTLGGHFSFAYAIDNANRIVGMSFTPEDANRRATLWQGGAAYDLGTLGGANSQAYSICDAGFVVGLADTAGGAPHAFRFTINAQGAVTLRVDLGALGGGYSTAMGVNDEGVVVGTSHGSAFIWRDGVMTDLNTRVSAPDWRLDTAWTINNAGQIAGTGFYLGQPRAFLLTPTLCGDLDGSGTVDQADLGILLADYGCAAGTCPGDIDGDGDTDQADLGILLAGYGQPCP